jgi:tRNA nucleotidyltransferase (CCA-adding enzyme)
MQDYAGDGMMDKLPKPVAEIIRAAGNAATQLGFNSYVVGGFVRDLVLGRRSRDIDIMIEGDALEVAGSLSEILDSIPTVHKRFGTATFKVGDYRMDLATCRSESYQRPGALPAVAPGDIKQDLFRRDFTVNAIALCIAPGEFGRMVDLYGGQRDIERRLVRVLHNKSFQDDATRIMRAVRYEQRLDFQIESKTLALLQGNLDMLDTISGDRLRHEVLLWLAEPQPGKILRRAAELGILSQLHPALVWNTHLDSAFEQVPKLAGAVPAEKLYLALLFCTLHGRQPTELLERLNIRGGETKAVLLQAIGLRDCLNGLDNPVAAPSEIYLKLKDYPVAAIAANALLTTSRPLHTNLFFYLEKLRFIKARLNGRDLEKMGVPRGSKVGAILDKLLAARLDGGVKTKADEERLARKLTSRL